MPYFSQETLIQLDQKFTDKLRQLQDDINELGSQGDTADTSDEIFELGSFSWESDARASRDVEMIALNKRRRDYQMAKERIEKGKYGLCDRCGKEIGAERLLAMETALFCSTCTTASRN